MSDRELFQRFPALRASIPWVPLAALPTPVVSLRAELPGSQTQDLWIKRDDHAGDPYGGNKVRKLEFLLAEAQHRGATRVVTAGAFGSHHALATAVYAKQLGMDVTVVVFPQRATPHVRAILFMLAGIGAELRFTRRMEFVPVALRRVRRQHGPLAHIIPPGGSDARGTLGYVECGLELARQWGTRAAPVPRRIHLAAGTLGTAAGLALGLAIAGHRIDIAATRITSRLVTNERALASLIAGASALLARDGAALPSVAEVMERVTFVHDQIGEGYGRATAAGDEAAKRLASLGIATDATYTAKAAAAWLADPLTARGETLFVHTLSAREPSDVAYNITLENLPAQIAARLTEHQ